MAARNGYQLSVISKRGSSLWLTRTESSADDADSFADSAERDSRFQRWSLFPFLESWEVAPGFK
ncbi:MAG: hypothetical protein DME76_10780 [Verrucomicrobia bacterium]|nr:MAG: hypothetical protein DME76_10780 [Verrucomicrobiota bacterium]